MTHSRQPAIGVAGAAVVLADGRAAAATRAGVLNLISPAAIGGPQICDIEVAN